MAVAVITGSCGLVGSESVAHFASLGFDVVGIDNDMRRRFFGDAASTDWVRRDLERRCRSYRHEAIDLRDQAAVERVFARYGRDIVLVVHAAAQPSHDWAAREPHTDFSVNATATLTLLECVRRVCQDAPLLFMSTNKVYGDHPNRLPLVELEARWEIEPSHRFAAGIDESMSIDGTMHSLFGVSKTAADLLVQEYGRYFGVKTTCFRAGCITGPNHSAASLHGFLSYLLQCVSTGTPYTVMGYKGKQVRDNIHSADLVAAFDAVYRDPGVADVYNIGGGRDCNCSMLEAIAICEEVAGRPLQRSYSDTARAGDHIWYVSDTGAFRRRYPSWRIRYDTRRLVQEMYDASIDRWKKAATTT